ncbi:hypothetical protein ACRQTN_05200 [Pectobacterium brasiliense]|uniref:hypothetical protein n=1 Tax=Pectobacterium brasiliense TaxID=180957 RepID=UPI003EBF3A67
MKKETVHTIEKTIIKIEVLIEVCKKNNESIISDELSSIQDELREMLSNSESSKIKGSCVNIDYVTRVLNIMKLIHDVYTRFF